MFGFPKEYVSGINFQHSTQEGKKIDFVNFLPQEMVLKIFPYLNADLARYQTVNKKFRVLAIQFMNNLASMQKEVQSLYAHVKNGDEDAIFSILQENIIRKRSDEFIHFLFKEEKRRFNEGYHAFDAYDGKNTRVDGNKLSCSHTVSRFLLTYEPQSADRCIFDFKTKKWMSKKPLINFEGYRTLVTKFLGMLPKELLDQQLLNPYVFSFKFDYYSIASLIFNRALEEYDFKIIKKLQSDPEFLNRVYRNPDNCKEEMPFWLHQAIRILKRGASIDHGYLNGGDSIFVSCARKLSYFCPLLLRHLNCPDRTGICDQAPIHAVIIKKLPISILEGLLAMGANKEARMMEGIFSTVKRTALEIATLVQNTEAVRVLLHHCANPNSFSERNGPPLHLRSEEAEPILTPFQAAVSKQNPQIIDLYLSHQKLTGIKLHADFHPEEQENRSKLSIRQPGERTLDYRTAAAQIQIAENRLDEVYNKTKLVAYAENETTRSELNQALLWIFEQAENCSAGPILMPIIQAFRKEISNNPSFAITATRHKGVGGCYNLDTQSDIYVYPDQAFATYRHVILHEVGHLYSAKYQDFHAFLHKFEEAMKKDGLLNAHLESDDHFPWELKYLLENMRQHYPEAHFEFELFPRVCVQFPLLYSLNQPNCTKEDLFQLMEKIMPETFKLYRCLVMN